MTDVRPARAVRRAFQLDARFSTTRDPFDALLALDQAARQGLPVPPHCAAWLADVAARIHAGELDLKLVLGYNRRGKHWGKKLSDVDAERVRQAYKYLVDQEGLSATKAKEQLARGLAVSVKTLEDVIGFRNTYAKKST